MLKITCHKASLIRSFLLPRRREQLSISRWSSSSNKLKQFQSEFIAKEKLILQKAHHVVQSCEGSQDDLLILRDILTRAEGDLFLLVITGEFNTGKSTLINTLLGLYDYLPTGVLPTTNKLFIIRNESSIELGKKSVDYFGSTRPVDIEERRVDLSWLQDVAIIDTPGTNSVHLDHDLLAKCIIPRADMVYFVTSAERPMSESEKVFLQHIHSWGRKITILLNKIDILSVSERDAVVNFVQQVCSTIFKEPVSIIPLSGRKALQALETVQSTCRTIDHSNEIYQSSGMGVFYNHINSVLQQSELLYNKLDSPLVTCEKILTSSSLSLEKRQHLLESDVRILEMVSEANEAFLKDIHRDVKSYRLHIDALCTKVLLSFDEFLESHVSIFRPFELLNVKSFIEKFQLHTAADISAPIERIVTDISQLVSQRARSHARDVLSHIDKRQHRVKESMMGSSDRLLPSVDPFEMIRERAFDALKREAVALVGQLSNQSKVQSMGQQLRTSASSSLGALTLSGLLLTQAADFTGLTAVSSIAIGGLVLIPWRKSVLRYMI